MYIFQINASSYIRLVRYVKPPLLMMWTITLFALLGGCVSTKEPSPYAYIPSPNPFQDVVRAQEKAVEQGKLLLVVLGAQWCHDSTGLAERFSTQEMDLILRAHYETVFVDVGPLEDRRKITERFAYPNYYATPTVMVVEPSSGALLNRTSMDIWGNADSIHLDDYLAYFSRYPAMTETQKAQLISWKPTNEEVAYNKEQAARLQRAYDKLGPLLVEDLNGNTPEGLNALWKEAKIYRTELQKTLVKRAELTLGEKGDNGVNTKPALRHYNPFSWEQN